jgi:hypothetical protein
MGETDKPLRSDDNIVIVLSQQRQANKKIPLHDSIEAVEAFVGWLLRQKGYCTVFEDKAKNLVSKSVIRI